MLLEFLKIQLYRLMLYCISKELNSLHGIINTFIIQENFLKIPYEFYNIIFQKRVLINF